MSKVLDAVTSDTNGSEIEWKGGPAIFMVSSSDFGGGTCQLEVTPDDGTTWIKLNGTDLTEQGSILLDRMPALKIRPALTGSTSPNALTAWLVGYYRP